jgi:methyl-accepting chemotaxis protein
VAQEVKALATQTEKATGQITQQICATELTTSQVVEAMKNVQRQFSPLGSGLQHGLMGYALKA